MRPHICKRDESVALPLWFQSSSSIIASEHRRAPISEAKLSATAGRWLWSRAMSGIDSSTAIISKAANVIENNAWVMAEVARLFSPAISHQLSLVMLWERHVNAVDYAPCWSQRGHRQKLSSATAYAREFALTCVRRHVMIQQSSAK